MSGRWLLVVLLLIPVVGAYQGYSDPSSGFSVPSGLSFSAGESHRFLSVSVADDAIYRQGWYSLDGAKWVPFNFSEAATGGWITSGLATVSLGVPASSSVDNYVLVYSCSRGAQWDCHGGRWQIRQFSLSVDQDITIVGVSDSAHQDGSLPEETLDGVLDETVSVWAAEGDGQWVVYELSDVAMMSYVRFLFAYGSKRTFDVQVSNDSASWVPVLVEVQSAGGLPAVFERFDFPVPVPARYVRFVGHGSNVSGRNGWNAIIETDINGFAVDLPVCVPVSSSVACAGLCGTQFNNCGQSIDCGSCSSDEVEVVYFNNFEQDPLGTISSATKSQDWTYCQSNPNSRIAQYSSDLYNPSKVYFHTFFEGEVSLTSTAGFRCQYDFPRGYDELYFSYKVKFGDGFDAVLGGKLPRIEAGHEGGGAGHCPTGTDFFTGGMMFKKYNGLPMPSFYIYYPDQWNTSWYRDNYYNVYKTYPTSCDDFFTDELVAYGIGGVYGDSFYWNAPLETGRWYTITERVVANTPGQYDGIVEGFVDGRLVRQVSGLRFRDVASLQIDWIDFVSFFGGDGDAWKTTKEEYIYFDDVIAYRYGTASDVPRGNVLWDADELLPAPQYPSESVLP